MNPLSNLPNEILLSIVEFLDREADINSLVRTSRDLYILLNIHLYRHRVQLENKRKYYPGCGSPLLWAAERGLINSARFSLIAGADTRWRKRDYQNSNALHLASAKGHLPVVALLLSHNSKADLESQTSQDLTSLQLATYHKVEPVARYLIEQGADFCKRYRGQLSQRTALHVASSFGSTSIVQLLLEKGADINTRDKFNQTPLHWAVKVDGPGYTWTGNVETVRLLLDRGADAYALDSYGQSPQSIAVKRNPDPRIRMMFMNRATIALCCQMGVELSDRVLEELATATSAADATTAAAPAVGAQVAVKGMVPLEGHQRMGILS
ncbi:hypothetical protein FQN54_006525 [Arachnomyces sp. PD_36]|nr:hypothetical protein FQN54_006525 [Arachnomyces sp. PD_36]